MARKHFILEMSQRCSPPCFWGGGWLKILHFCMRKVSVRWSGWFKNQEKSRRRPVSPLNMTKVQHRIKITTEKFSKYFSFISECKLEFLEEFMEKSFMLNKYDEMKRSRVRIIENLKFCYNKVEFATKFRH